jgi:RNA polymerase sigma-70 factor, ECF subfamily
MARRVSEVQPPRARKRPIRQPLRAPTQLAYERLSDPILVKRAKDGDRQALETLCARHQATVEKLARRILRDREEARDAAQESLAKVCARIGQFRGEAQFATWLHRLVVNTCRDAIGRRTTWEPLPDGVQAAPTAEVSDRDELRTCLLELPPAQARVVVLKDALGYSFEEIAAASGMPVGTAKCYAHRARNTLRARLEENAA